MTFEEFIKERYDLTVEKFETFFSDLTKEELRHYYNEEIAPINRKEGAE